MMRGFVHAIADDRGNLLLRLRGGDLKQGYFDVDLHYQGVSRFYSAPSVERLAAIDEFEVIRDELDVESSSIFHHRMLFARRHHHHCLCRV